MADVRQWTTHSSRDVAGGTQQGPRGDQAAAGITDRGLLHRFRDTIKTRMSEHGISERVSEHILGHVVPGIAGTYDHAEMLTQRREALAWWDEELDRILRKTPRTQPANVVPITTADRRESAWDVRGAGSPIEPLADLSPDPVPGPEIDDPREGGGMTHRGRPLGALNKERQEPFERSVEQLVPGVEVLLVHVSRHPPCRQAFAGLREEVRVFT